MTEGYPEPPRRNPGHIGYPSAMSDDADDARELLHLYVDDHRAGATAGLELAERMRDENADTTFGDPLAEIAAEIAEDAQTLDRLADRYGIQRHRIKQLGAAVGERLGRLVPNGRATGYSPLSRVLELEGLMSGVDAKRNLWRTLQLGGARAEDGSDLAVLEARATDQHRRLSELHLRAAREAFTISPAADASGS